MNARHSVSSLGLVLFLSMPVGAAAQSVLVQAKTSGGAEVATIRTDSMRLLVPLRVLGTGLEAGALVADDSLRVGGEGSVLAMGAYQSGTAMPAPVSGAGTRLMWYPEKAAFRAGFVDGTQWDASGVGDYSMAMGYNAIANNTYSVSIGDRTTADGVGSTALGSYTLANGSSSAALNFGTIATGTDATALGNRTIAQAYGSLVIGQYNVIAGTSGSWVSTEPLLVAGNGISSGSPSNALTLSKDGNMTIAGTLTQSSDARLKEDMEPLEGTLAKVMQLTPIRYRFRPNTGRPRGEQIGLTAQQVRPLFPELVKQDGDGYLSLSYANLSAVLVKAVQEQQAEITRVRQQQAQVAPLKVQVRTLQERNHELESQLRATQSEVETLKASQAEILRRLRALEAAGGR